MLSLLHGPISGVGFGELLVAALWAYASYSFYQLYLDSALQVFLCCNGVYRALQLEKKTVQGKGMLR